MSTKAVLSQQVLTALEESVDLVRNEYAEAVEMYRHPSRKAKLDGMKALLDNHEAAIASLRTALAEGERKQIEFDHVGDANEMIEPVATVLRGGVERIGKATCFIRWEPGSEKLPDGQHQLYTHPSPAALRAAVIELPIEPPGCIPGKDAEYDDALFNLAVDHDYHGLYREFIRRYLESK